MAQKSLGPSPSSEKWRGEALGATPSVGASLENFPFEGTLFCSGRATPVPRLCPRCKGMIAPPKLCAPGSAAEDLHRHIAAVAVDGERQAVHPVSQRAVDALEWKSDCHRRRAAGVGRAGYPFTAPAVRPDDMYRRNA